MKILFLAATAFAFISAPTFANQQKTESAGELERRCFDKATPDGRACYSLGRHQEDNKQFLISLKTYMQGCKLEDANSCSSIKYVLMHSPVQKSKLDLVDYPFSGSSSYQRRLNDRLGSDQATLNSQTILLASHYRDLSCKYGLTKACTELRSSQKEAVEDAAINDSTSQKIDTSLKVMRKGCGGMFNFQAVDLNTPTVERRYEVIKYLNSFKNSAKKSPYEIWATGHGYFNGAFLVQDANFLKINTIVKRTKAGEISRSEGLRQYNESLIALSRTLFNFCRDTAKSPVVQKYYFNGPGEFSATKATKDSQKEFNKLLAG